MSKQNYTQEQIEARTSDYICFDCGRPFIEGLEKTHGGVSTFHVSECGLCKENKGVTHMRHWNYLRIREDVKQ